MKIIKRGELPQDEVRQDSCHKCKTVMEFKVSEILRSPDQRDPLGEGYVICPLCMSQVWVHRK